MTDTKISDLPLLATGLASNTVPIEDALTTRKLTLSKIHQFCSAQGADVASAAVVVLGGTDQEEEFFHITGTVTITDIDFIGQQWSGRRAWVVFDGSLTLTHNATTLILPTGANIQTAAGDIACFVQDGGTADNVRCIAYIRASGRPLVFDALASTTEVLTGTDAAKVVTPDALAAVWEKGADVASAGTLSLGDGMFFHITGTTTITDIDWAVAKDGRVAILTFDGILTLTHNATTLILPGGANITTAAGDCCVLVQDAADNVRVVAYQRATGQALIQPASEVGLLRPPAGAAGANTAPLKLTSGTLNTAAEDGALEMDADCMYGTVDADNRGVVGLRHFIRADATRNFTSNTSAQALFTSPANGRLTLELGTYLFEGLIYVTGMSGTSGNALIDIVGAGTAVTGSWAWGAWGVDSTSPTASAGLGGSFAITKASPASIVTAATGTGMVVMVRGSFEVTTAGTIIPSMTMVTASASVLNIGSYLSFERIGSTSVVSVGQWD